MFVCLAVIKISTCTVKIGTYAFAVMLTSTNLPELILRLFFLGEESVLLRVYDNPFSCHLRRDNIPLQYCVIMTCVIIACGHWAFIKNGSDSFIDLFRRICGKLTFHA